MRLVVLVAATALVACQSVNGPEQRPGVASAASTPQTVVRGRATYLERILLAPGATLDVQLIDDASADASGAATATIASARWNDLQGPPYDFALPYDATHVDAKNRYSLRATLRDAGGHLEFATDRRVEVVPGASKVVEFRLVKVTD
ncbi:YbaY family lipoprotein [Dokdonella sp.]|uniref:YbaY family lipoprotein n=1 Tax=Dokdonella sp. TaxID=2291710 RepID=UPI003783929F